MLSSKTLLLTLSCFLSVELMAQGNKDIPGMENETESTGSSDNSSENVRSGQSAMFGARTGFIHTMPGIGLEGAWLYNSSLQIGGHLGIGQLDLKDAVEDEFGVRIDKAMVRSFSTGVQARWFLLNSFYLTSGLEYRTIGTDIRVEDSIDSSIFIETKTTSDSICLDVGLGNLWSFGSGFYIGAEWFGASIPFSSSFDSEVSSGGLVTDELKKTADENEDLAKKLSKAVTYRLAMLQIGWAF